MTLPRGENRVVLMLRRLLDWGCAVSAFLACVFLFLIGALVLAQVIGRMFGVLVPSAIDFAAFSMAASTFLGLSWAFRSNAHIRVLLVLNNLPSRARRGAEMFNLTLAAAMTGFVALQTFKMTWISWEFGDVSIGLIPVPLWIPQSALCFGAGMACLVLIDELCRVLAGGERAFPGDADETSAKAKAN